MNSLSRTVPLLSFPASLRPILAARLYATQTGLGTTGSPRPRRKAVTAFNDDGRVAWGDLSMGEKAARTTQQTFNFGMIILGAVLTVGPMFRTYKQLLIPCREAWHMLCTQKSFRRTVKRAISTVRSTR